MLGDGGRATRRRCRHWSRPAPTCSSPTAGPHAAAAGAERGYARDGGDAGAGGRALIGARRLTAQRQISRFVQGHGQPRDENSIHGSAGSEASILWRFPHEPCLNPLVPMQQLPGNHLPLRLPGPLCAVGQRRSRFGVRMWLAVWL